jgi:hypothetical protein
MHCSTWSMGLGAGCMRKRHQWATGARPCCTTKQSPRPRGQTKPKRKPRSRSPLPPPTGLTQCIVHASLAVISTKSSVGSEPVTAVFVSHGMSNSERGSNSTAVRSALFSFFGFVRVRFWFVTFVVAVGFGKKEKQSVRGSVPSRRCSDISRCCACAAAATQLHKLLEHSVGLGVGVGGPPPPIFRGNNAGG